MVRGKALKLTQNSLNRHFICKIPASDNQFGAVFSEVIMINNIKEVCSFLDGINIGYEIFHHSPAFTLEECREIEKIIRGEICKNLLLRTTSGDKYFLLMMKGDKKFVTKDVSKKLGSSRLSFAQGEEMISMLRTQPGSLSVTSLIFDKEKKITLAVDKEVFENEFVCCHPCDNSATLKIRTDDIVNTLLPELEIRAEIIEI